LTIVRWVTLVFAVAGCWSSAPTRPPTAAATPPQSRLEPPPAPPRYLPKRRTSRCATAIDHALELSRPELDQIAQLRDRLDVLRDAVVESCQDASWSDETLGCFEDANDASDMRDCQSKLTTEQSDQLRRRLQDVFTAP
jgi:hypothetical protein